MNVSATFSLVCLNLIVIRTDHLNIYTDQSFKNSLNKISLNVKLRARDESMLDWTRHTTAMHACRSFGFIRAANGEVHKYGSDR